MIFIIVNNIMIFHFQNIYQFSQRLNYRFTSRNPKTFKRYKNFMQPSHFKFVKYGVNFTTCVWKSRSTATNVYWNRVRACITRELYDKERNIRFFVCPGRCHGAKLLKVNKFERTIRRMIFLKPERDTGQILMP